MRRFTDPPSPPLTCRSPRRTQRATAVPRMNTAADSAAIASATEPLSAAPTAAAIRTHSAPATYPGVPRRNTGQRHRGRRGGDEADRLPRCLVGRPAAENQRGATWTNTATMRQPRYRPKVMVASRVSQRGQVMSSPWRSSSRMMLINAAPSREHCDAGPQPVSGGDHQPGAEAENTSDASTSARFPAPRRARTGPSPRRSPRRAHRPVPDAEGIPGRGDRGFVGRTGGQEVSGERVGDPRCGDGSAPRRPLPQRHTRTAVVGGSTPSATRAISEPLCESTGFTTRRPGSRSRCGAGTGWSTAGRTTTWWARRRVGIRRRAASRGAVWCARRWRRGRGRR